MQKRILTMDDMREGMFITILRGRIEERMVSTPEGPKMRKKENPMYKGKVLEVISVDMPYMVVACHARSGAIRDTIDLREVQTQQLSMEYVVSMVPKVNLKTDKFWDKCTIEEMGIIDDSLKNDDTSIEDADTTIGEIFEDL